MFGFSHTDNTVMLRKVEAQSAEALPNSSQRISGGAFKIQMLPAAGLQPHIHNRALRVFTLGGKVDGVVAEGGHG